MVFSDSLHILTLIFPKKLQDTQETLFAKVALKGIACKQAVSQGSRGVGGGGGGELAHRLCKAWCNHAQNSNTN